MLALVSSGAVALGGFGVVNATTHDTESPPGSTVRTAMVPAPPAPAGGAGDGREARRTLPPVAQGRAATPQNGLTVTVDEIRPVESDAQGPGMMGGPAVTVVVTVRNDTARQLRTPGGSMSLTYGPEDIPADFAPQPDDRPVPPVIEPGAEASGSYTFVLPEAQRDDLTITFNYSPANPAAVFTGSAAAGGAGQ